MADPQGFMQFGSPFVPQTPDIVASPPTNQADMDQRAGGWAKLQSYMQNPDIQLAMLKVGLQLMQPVPVGQTTGGHVASALGQSVDYLGAIREQRRRQELEDVRVRSEAELRAAETARSRAETAAVPARVRETTARATRLEKLTPLEVDQAARQVALLDIQIKDAPNETERKRLQMEREALNLKLDQEYGGKLKESELEFKASASEYNRAHAAAQRALTQKYGDDAHKWKVRDFSRDADTGATFTLMENPDGRTSRIVVKPGLSASEAKREATAEVKLLSSDEFKARYGSVSKDVVINKLARGKTKETTDIKTYEVDPTTGAPHEVGAGPAPRNFSTRAEALTWMQSESRAGRQARATWDTDETTQRGPGSTSTFPLPKAMADKVDGTPVPAISNSDAAAVSPWWKKQGDKLVPASQAHVDAWKKAAEVQKAPSTGVNTGVSSGGVQNAPPDISVDVAQRYSKRVRGVTRFDYQAYEADMQEYQFLKAKTDKAPAVVGRMKFLEHKLELPPVEEPVKPPEKSKKLSFRVKRGADGKIEGLDMEDQA